MNYRYMEALKGLNHLEVDRVIESWYQKATMFEAMVESEMQFRVLTVMGLRCLLGDPPAEGVKDLCGMLDEYTGKVTAVMLSPPGESKEGGDSEQRGRAGSGGPEAGGGDEDRGSGEVGEDPGKAKKP